MAGILSMSALFVGVLVMCMPGALALVNRRSSPAAFPRNSKFVIILRGQTFRAVDKSRDIRFSCDEFSLYYQLNNSASVVEHIIDPLEALGNKVDVIVTDEQCSLTGKISKMFGDRVVSQKSFAATGQADNFRKAINVLNDNCGGAKNVKKHYDYVLVFRQDLLWRIDLMDWKADWNNVNFFARCEEKSSQAVGGANCVWDTVHIVPTKYYQAFDGLVGVHKYFDKQVNRYFSCFSLKEDPDGHGHACYWPAMAAVQNVSSTATIGMVSDIRFRVRAPNPILDLTLPRKDKPLPRSATLSKNNAANDDASINIAEDRREKLHNGKITKDAPPVIEIFENVATPSLGVQ